MVYTIVKSNIKQDAEKIRLFWNNNFPAWPSEKFDWFYLNNLNGYADCWLLSDSQSCQIVGVAAVFPRLFYFNGNLLSAGIAGDFAVDKNHRTLGAALQLQKAVVKYCEEKSNIFVYGYPNHRSEVVQKRVGFQKNCAVSRYVRILKTRRLLAKYFTNHYLLSLLRFLCDSCLFVFARESRVRVNARRYRFELLARPDIRFDVLWERARVIFPLIGERSARFLTWRFAECPYREFKFFIVTDKSTNELIGYIIYYEYEGTVCVADILYLNVDELSGVLIPYFIKSINSGLFDNISILTSNNHEIVDSLKKFQFVKRDEDRSLMIFKGPGISDIEDLFEPIYFFEADND